MTGDLRVRVHVLEAWDEVVMERPAATSIASIKEQALTAAHVAGDPDDFLVKFRGAELRDQTRSLADEQVPGDGALIVVRRRRVAVR